MYEVSKIEGKIKSEVIPKQSEDGFVRLPLSHSSTDINGTPIEIEVSEVGTGILVSFSTGENVHYSYKDLMESSLSMIGSAINSENLIGIQVRGHSDKVDRIQDGKIASLSHD